MTDVTLGIDVGTSGVRVVARAKGGEMLAMATAPMPEANQRDPAQWWQALQHAVLALDCTGLNILAVAVDGTSGTILPVGADGEALDLASMYNAVADETHIATVKKFASAESAALGATSPLARAMAFEHGQILHQADWLVGKLCGNFKISDENNALKTGYDPLARRWPAWISKMGFDVTRLPQVVAAGTNIDLITPASARLLNLPVECVVVAGTTDGCAAFLASGAKDFGDGVTSLGTTLTLKMLSATPVFAPDYGIYSHRIGDQWLAGGASNTGGGVLGHLFSPAEIANFTSMLRPHESTGLNYYPLKIAGERFPINDATLQPKLQPRPQDDHVFFQAVLEGIADIEALGYQRLRELGASPLRSIRSVGGGAQNAPWTEMRLQRLGVKSLAPSSEHAAMGVARLAWRGIGFDE